MNHQFHGPEPIEIRATNFIEDADGDPLGVHTDRHPATLTVEPDPASEGTPGEVYDLIDDEPTLRLGGRRQRTHPVRISDAILVTTGGCPSCGGEWERELVFQHAIDCSIRAAEDGRLAADAGIGVLLHRPATDIEKASTLALGGTQADIGRDDTMFIEFTTPSFRRRLGIGRLSFNRFATAAEIADPLPPVSP